MSIQEKFSDAMERIKSDPDLANEFKEDPVKTAESVLGVDLPDEQIQASSTISRIMWIWVKLKARQTFLTLSNIYSKLKNQRRTAPLVLFFISV